MFTTLDRFSGVLKDKVQRIEGGIRNEVKIRAFNVSNSMRNVTLQVLSGQRHGRIYKYHNHFYQASAPGEPPAVRSGILRLSFKPQTAIDESEHGMMIHSRASSNVKYAGYLENGTHQMKPRPYGNQVFNRSVNQAIIRFRRPYV